MMSAVMTLVFVAFAATLAAGQESACGDAAERTLSSAESWSDLRNWFESYPGCDDGSLGAEATYLVAELLTEAPSTLKRLDAECKRNPEFTPFVLRNVNEMWSREQLQTLVQSTHKCRKDLVVLCSKLARAAETTLSGESGLTQN